MHIYVYIYIYIYVLYIYIYYIIIYIRIFIIFKIQMRSFKKKQLQLLFQQILLQTVGYYGMTSRRWYDLEGSVAAGGRPWAFLQIQHELKQCTCIKNMTVPINMNSVYWLLLVGRSWGMIHLNFCAESKWPLLYRSKPSPCIFPWATWAVANTLLG